MNEENNTQRKQQANSPKQELDRVIQEIAETKADKISRSERTNQILIAYKGHKKDLGLRRPLQEPIMLLRRRSGRIEIREGVTQGRFDFKHSNGDERFLIVDPSTQDVLCPGKDQIRMYLASEDSPVTGWPDPVTTTEQINIFVEKTLADVREWMLKKDKMKMQWVLYIAGAIGIILLGVGIMRSMTPSAPTIIYQAATNATEIINQTAQLAVAGMINNGSQII